MSDETSTPGGPTPESTGWQTANVPTPATPAENIYAAQTAAPVTYGSPPKKKKTWLWVLLGIFTVFVLGIGGCIAVVFHIATSDSPEVTALHAQMKSNDLAGIFNGADPQYQKEVGQAQSDAFFSNVHNQLGSPVSSKQTGVNLDAQGVKTLTVKTHFDKGDETETIKFHKRGTDWKLISYDLDPPPPAAPAAAPATAPSDGTTTDGTGTDGSSGSSTSGSGDNQ
jgi:hypothetical protein